jgi:hypothetical protein
MDFSRMYRKIKCTDGSSLYQKSTFQLLIYTCTIEMDFAHVIPAAEQKPVYSILQ